MLDRNTVRRLLALARPHVGRLILATVCLIISTAGFLAVPYIIRQLTDSVFVHHDAAGLNRLALALLALVAATAVFGYLRGYLVSYVGGRVVADLRVRLYRHLLGLGLEFYDEHRAGDLMSRLTADTTLVQAVVTDNLLSVLRESLTLIAVLVIVLTLDWRLALITATLGPLVAVIGAVVGRRTRRLSTRAQEQLGAASVVLEETLPSMRVVMAFGQEGYERHRYASAVEGSFSLALSAAKLRSGFEALMLTTSFAALAAVLWFGGHEVLSGRLTPGGLISFLFYLVMLMGPIQTLASAYTQFQQAAGGAARIFETLDTASAVVDAPDAYPLPPVRGEVQFKDVWFRYATSVEDVLRGVRFVAHTGQRLAVVGPSGAGKTTLVSLLPRFYDPTRGSICIDGHDAARVTQESLRATMAIVPQEPTLFGGTVRENIAYGRIGASDAEIEMAARAANAHTFIASLPHGYDTVVGDRGVKLSGGQRQRIAIARAVLKDPRVLILDEATSALDNESEALVQEALERLMAGRTTFVIAHRLTTVENADCIVVLDNGRVVEQGTHSQLLAQNGLYQRLYTRDFFARRALEHDLV